MQSKDEPVKPMSPMNLSSLTGEPSLAFKSSYQNILSWWDGSVEPPSDASSEASESSADLMKAGASGPKVGVPPSTRTTSRRVDGTYRSTHLGTTRIAYATCKKDEASKEVTDAPVPTTSRIQSTAYGASGRSRITIHSSALATSAGAAVAPSSVREATPPPAHSPSASPSKVVGSSPVAARSQPTTPAKIWRGSPIAGDVDGGKTAVGHLLSSPVPAGSATARMETTPVVAGITRHPQTTPPAKSTARLEGAQTTPTGAGTPIHFQTTTVATGTANQSTLVKTNSAQHLQTTPLATGTSKRLHQTSPVATGVIRSVVGGSLTAPPAQRADSQASTTAPAQRQVVVLSSRHGSSLPTAAGANLAAQEASAEAPAAAQAPHGPDEPRPPGCEPVSAARRLRFEDPGLVEPSPPEPCHTEPGPARTPPKLSPRALSPRDAAGAGGMQPGSPLSRPSYLQRLRAFGAASLPSGLRRGSASSMQLPVGRSSHTTVVTPRGSPMRQRGCATPVQEAPRAASVEATPAATPQAGPPIVAADSQASTPLMPSVAEGRVLSSTKVLWPLDGKSGRGSFQLRPCPQSTLLNGRPQAPSAHARAGAASGPGTAENSPRSSASRALRDGSQEGRQSPATARGTSTFRPVPRASVRSRSVSLSRADNLPVSGVKVLPVSQEPDVLGTPSRFLGPAGRDPVVLCIGDSITKGIVAHGDSYPQHLLTLLQDSGQRMLVVNAGVWGESCQQMHSRLHSAVRTACAAGNLVCVLVLGGTNDIMALSPAPRVLAALRRLHDGAAGSPGAPAVGVLTIPPATKYSEGQEKTRTEVNNCLRAECAHSAGNRRFLVETGQVSSDLCADGVHFFGEGHQEFAKLVFKAMRENRLLQ